MLCRSARRCFRSTRSVHVLAYSAGQSSLLNTAAARGVAKFAYDAAKVLASVEGLAALAALAAPRDVRFRTASAFNRLIARLYRRQTRATKFQRSPPTPSRSTRSITACCTKCTTRRSSLLCSSATSTMPINFCCASRRMRSAPNLERAEQARQMPHVSEGAEASVGAGAGTGAGTGAERALEQATLRLTRIPRRRRRGGRRGG